jgi:hypothetical protein
MEKMADVSGKCLHGRLAVVGPESDHVHDNIEFFLPERLVKGLAVVSVARDTPDQAAKIVGSQAAVEERHLVPISQELFNQVVTQKAGPADDEYFHSGLREAYPLPSIVTASIE